MINHPRDVPDLTGRIALITGGTSGVGEATARLLARAGAAVVITGRDDERGPEVADSLAAHARGGVTFRRLELGDLDDVRRAGAAMTAAHERIDLLVANAGLMNEPPGTTADGFGWHMGANHLGHVALILELLPLVVACGPGRVVTVSSGAHMGGRIEPASLGDPAASTYANSKLANLLFAFELDRRLARAGSAARSVAAHPGWVPTRLFDGSNVAVRGLARLIGHPPDQAALSIASAALCEGLPSPAYVGPGGLGGIRGKPALDSASSQARDARLAAAVFDESLRLTDSRWPAELGSGGER